MNLRQLEVFHAVYLHGTVSAAARSLNVSQPSVTKVLRHAEDSIGLPLFERARGRLIPTQDARALFGEVSEIQDRVRSLRQACHNMRLGRGSLLRISALPSLGLGAIPDAVAEFLRGHEDILFDLQTLHHENMHQWWGDNVSEASYNLTFFKEGLATLGEFFFVAGNAQTAAGGSPAAGRPAGRLPAGQHVRRAH